MSRVCTLFDLLCRAMPGTRALFAELSQSRKIEPPAVPLIIVGEAVYVGYGDDATSGAEIEAQVNFVS